MKKFWEKTINILNVSYNEVSIPPSVHKILIHGRFILEIMCKEKNLSPLSLAEENTEACVKLIRLCRNRFSRKDSRVNNLRDICNYLMIFSDPYINSFETQKMREN